MSKTLTEEDLLDLKKDIDTAKTNTAQLEGQKKELMKQLKENWDCETIAEAEKKLKKLQTKYKETEEQIADGIAELQEKYLDKKEE
jgi:predicted  nucleic acid-binding Zn-ribbon protein